MQSHRSCLLVGSLLIVLAACGLDENIAPTPDGVSGRDASADASVTDASADATLDVDAGVVDVDAGAEAGDAALAADVALLDGGLLVDAGACHTTITAYPTFASPHVPVCSPVTYGTNPPTSGPHYPIWAAYQSYATPVPRGFYVHDLEHGAVVILYNCPSGCASDVAALQQFLDARPADPLCLPPVKSRIVVTPDPLSPTPFAAAAWGHTLTAECLDLATLGAFIDAHYAKAPENECANGVNVTSPDAGFAPDCGL